MWVLVHPRASIGMLGLIPSFLHADDPRPAAEQFNERYVFGGWRPVAGIEPGPDYSFLYPGDPPQPALAMYQLRDETIVIYPHAFVGIWRPGSLEVARLD